MDSAVQRDVYKRQLPQLMQPLPGLIEGSMNINLFFVQLFYFFIFMWCGTLGCSLPLNPTLSEDAVTEVVTKNLGNSIECAFIGFNYY